MFLAQNLKYLRNRNDEQQKELAEMVNVTAATICKYENGDVEPNLNTLVMLAKHFRVSLDDLVLSDLRPPVPQYVLNIKYLREKKKLTQQELADELNVSRSTIAGYEAEGKQPSIDKLSKISDYFGVTLDQLVKQDLSKEGGD